MPDQHRADPDEHDLLDLIEGELAPEEAETIRVSLRRDPILSARVELMCDDRAALGSIPDPDMPFDMTDRVMTALDGPVVMTSPPGALRRAQARRARARLATRVAAAAVVMLAAVLGLFGLVRTIASDPSGDSIARVEGAGGLAGPSVATPGPVGPPRTTERRPEIGQIGPAVASIVQAPGLRNPPATVGPPRGEPGALRPADFALVVGAADRDAVESALAQALADLGPSVALVRNFSERELVAMLESSRAGSNRSGTSRAGARRGGSGPERTAGIGTDRAAPSDPLGTNPIVGREGAPSAVRSMPAPAPTSAPLVGPGVLAPSVEQQLELSTRGATYTVTLPVSRLQQLLVTLKERLGPSSCTLRPIGDDGLSVLTEEGEQRELVRWVIDLPRLRDAAERIRSDDEQALMLLPVVVRDDC